VSRHSPASRLHGRAFPGRRGADSEPETGRAALFRRESAAPSLFPEFTVRIEWVGFGQPIPSSCFSADQSAAEEPSMISLISNPRRLIRSGTSRVSTTSSRATPSEGHGRRAVHRAQLDPVHDGREHVAVRRITSEMFGTGVFVIR
jgi:hypothetical protein